MIAVVRSSKTTLSKSGGAVAKSFQLGFSRQKSTGVGFHCLLRKVVREGILSCCWFIRNTLRFSSLSMMLAMGLSYIAFIMLRYVSSRRGKWHPTPVLFSGKSYGWRSLVGCSPWGREESDMTERLHFHFSLSCIGKEMATHSSILAWKIPGTMEPGGLPSMGSHRVGHDWSDLAVSSSMFHLCPLSGEFFFIMNEYWILSEAFPASFEM